MSEPKPMPTYWALAEEVTHLHGHLDKLQAENAKLRELVRLMVRRHTLTRTCMDVPCGECPAKDECDQEDALMRELGVEVDA